MIDYGKIMVCDRCGKTAFCRKVGKEFTDGGYTNYDKYDESAAKGWGEIPNKENPLAKSQVCPDCYQDFLGTLERYYKRREVMEEKP